MICPSTQTITILYIRTHSLSVMNIEYVRGRSRVAYVKTLNLIVEYAFQLEAYI